MTRVILRVAAALFGAFILTSAVMFWLPLLGHATGDIYDEYFNPDGGYIDTLGYGYRQANPLIWPRHHLSPRAIGRGPIVAEMAGAMRLVEVRLFGFGKILLLAMIAALD